MARVAVVDRAVPGREGQNQVSIANATQFRLDAATDYNWIHCGDSSQWREASMSPDISLFEGPGANNFHSGD